MGVVMNEPSMEDILSSIKRIIADGSDRVTPVRSLRRRGPDRDDSDGANELDTSSDGNAEQGTHATEEGDPAILELTDMVEEPMEMNEAATTPRKATQRGNAQQAQASSPQAQSLQAQSPQVEPEDMILSDISTQATRQSLNQLSSLLVRPQDGEAHTLEGLVREMLRPMLKDWLEDNLPDLVQSMVKKEIDRIVGRLG